MITITVNVEDGVVTFLEAMGHANASPVGEDVVCGSVTFLLRTFVRLLCSGDTDGVKSFAEAPREGVLRWEMQSFSPGVHDRLTGAGELLLRGLRDLAEEFPHYVRVEIKGELYGT